MKKLQLLLFFLTIHIGCFANIITQINLGTISFAKYHYYKVFPHNKMIYIIYGISNQNGSFLMADILDSKLNAIQDSIVLDQGGIFKPEDIVFNTQNEVFLSWSSQLNNRSADFYYQKFNLLLSPLNNKKGKIPYHDMNDTFKVFEDGSVIQCEEHIIKYDEYKPSSHTLVYNYFENNQKKWQYKIKNSVITNTRNFVLKTSENIFLYTKKFSHVELKKLSLNGKFVKNAKIKYNRSLQFSEDKEYKDDIFLFGNDLYLKNNYKERSFLLHLTQNFKLVNKKELDLEKPLYKSKKYHSIPDIFPDQRKNTINLFYTQYHINPSVHNSFLKIKGFSEILDPQLKTLVKNEIIQKNSDIKVNKAGDYWVDHKKFKFFLDNNDENSNLSVYIFVKDEIYKYSHEELSFITKNDIFKNWVYNPDFEHNIINISNDTILTESKKNKTLYLNIFSPLDSNIDKTIRYKDFSNVGNVLEIIDNKYGFFVFWQSPDNQNTFYSTFISKDFKKKSTAQIELAITELNTNKILPVKWDDESISFFLAGYPNRKIYEIKLDEFGRLKSKNFVFSTKYDLMNCYTVQNGLMACYETGIFPNKKWNYDLYKKDSLAKRGVLNFLKSKNSICFEEFFLRYIDKKKKIDVTQLNGTKEKVTYTDKKLYYLFYDRDDSFIEADPSVFENYRKLERINDLCFFACQKGISLNSDFCVNPPLRNNKTYDLFYCYNLLKKQKKYLFHANIYFYDVYDNILKVFCKLDNDCYIMFFDLKNEPKAIHSLKVKINPYVSGFTNTMLISQPNGCLLIFPLYNDIYNVQTYPKLGFKKVTGFDLSGDIGKKYDLAEFSVIPIKKPYDQSVLLFIRKCN